MSIFVNSKKLLEGEVFYVYSKTEGGEDRPRPINTDVEKEFYKDKLHTIKVYFKRPNYKLFSYIMQQSLVNNPDGTITTHPMAMREAYLKTLLVKWDLKDEESGEHIPVSPDLIDNLYPDMALAILNEFDRLTAADSDTSDFDALRSKFEEDNEISLSITEADSDVDVEQKTVNDSSEV